MSPPSVSPTPEDPSVAHALAYPFDPPSDPYFFENGHATPLDLTRHAEAFEGRAPILAVGSNAAPLRLAQKFPANVRAPVTRAIVEDYVVAHSAKFAGYASVPATLHPWPGARAHLHITWLTPEQLAIMDETETLGVAYDRVPLEDVALRDIPENLRVQGPVETYVSRAGAFGVDGKPAVSAAARLENIEGAAVFTQAEIQARACSILGLGADVHAFIAENIRDSAVRAARSSQLSAQVGLPFHAASA